MNDIVITLSALLLATGLAAGCSGNDPETDAYAAACAKLGASEVCETWNGGPDGAKTFALGNCELAEQSASLPYYYQTSESAFRAGAAAFHAHCPQGMEALIAGVVAQNPSLESTANEIRAALG